MAKVTSHTMETTVSAAGILPKQVRIRFNYSHGVPAMTGVDSHISGTAGPRKWEAPLPAIAAAARAWFDARRADARRIAREDIAEKKARVA